MLCSLIFFSFKSAAQAGPLDSVIVEAQEMVEDSAKVKKLNKIAQKFIGMGDFRQAEVFGRRAYEAAKRIGYMEGLGYACNELGVTYLSFDRMNEALKFNREALSTFSVIALKRGMASAYNNIANVYLTQKNLEEALRNYYTSLELKKQFPEKQPLVNNYNNIGLVHYYRSDLNKALESYSMALQIAREVNDKRGISNALNNMGIAEDLKGNKLKALEYYEETLKMKQEMNDKFGTSAAYQNMAIIYLDLKKYDKAESYLNKVLRISKETGSLNHMKECQLVFMKLYKAKGDFKKANEAYRLYVAAKDGAASEDINKQFLQTQLRSKFERERAADSIRAAERMIRENMEHEAKIRQQRFVMTGGLMGFILMMVVALVSVKASRDKERSNKIILAQKKLVEEKQTEILDSIRYAGRIQKALITSEKSFEKNFNRLNRNR